MTSLFPVARRTALAAGALFVLGGVALRVFVYVETRLADHRMHLHHAMRGLSAGMQTASVLGTLLLLEGVLLVLTGLLVLRPIPVSRPHGQREPQRPASTGLGGPMNDLDVDTARVVTIGGGLGSFALVDRLRIAGVAASDIRVVSTTADPAAHFADLCRSSGLLPGDRLRSDSSARMDNIWGFPGYAATEARQRRSPVPVLRTMLEPVAAQPYTPTVRLLVDGLRREADRIGWSDMATTGEAYRVTRLSDGDYLVLVRRPGRRDLAIKTPWVHLALGSAGPRVEDVADTFRTSHGAERVVHVYEPHEEVYQQLRRSGGNVLLRGSGIAAARVLERLIEDRDHTGRDIHIWHLFRTYHAAPSGPATRRHDAGQGFHYQRDSFPKAAYGGQIRDEIRALDEPERIELIRRLGATSTPYRSTWARQLRRGRAEGWYDAVVGEIARLAPRENGVTATILLGTRDQLDLDVDFLIDATGMDTAAEHHHLVQDLVEEGLGELNELGGLRVDDDFIVSRSEVGGVVASGMTVTGAPLAPVDSFLGLQSAALSIAHTLAEAGIGHPLTPLRSLRSWWHWMEGASL